MMFISCLTIPRRSVSFGAALLLLLSIPALAQKNTGWRVQFSINDNWRFYPSGAEFASGKQVDVSAWERVDLPHTWNAKDPFDDDATYRRGISWYRRTLVMNEQLKGKRIFIYFEGSNQVTDVYVNGNYVGQHRGGYTAFRFDITEFIKYDGVANSIAVQVNNATDFLIPPLSVGYAMYGGIYRDVWMEATDPLHFSTSDHGAGGVYISTPKVTEQEATIKIKGLVKNDGQGPADFEVVHSIYDAAQKLMATQRNTIQAGANQETAFEADLGAIASPKLWSPEQPYLYQVVSEIIHNGKVVDKQTNPLGFRWFSFNPETGFSLNGKKYVLKGTNRHQDFKGKGSALTNEDHYRDLKIIKDMGCNFLRLAHYPQDPEVLRLADQMGLLIWEEIPVVNNMNPDPGFLKNAQYMLREMIRQHYNHPSIILWGSMNEVLLWSKGNERIQVHTDEVYLQEVRKFQVKMDSTLRSEDPSRYSTMAMHMSKDYEQYKMAEIPQVAGWNIYDGWYSGKVEEFGPAFDKKHREHPNEVLLVSEYGAESDLQVNTENPQRLDFSGAYQRYYHESYLSQINKRPYFAGTAIWNQFDFSQPNIGGTISHVNHKGMLTWDRIYKDVYYLYKANWNPEPMVYIASRDWMHRGGKSGQASTLEAYTNLPEVALTVNGKRYPTQKPNEIGKVSWKVKFLSGANIVIASGTKNGKNYTDQLAIRYEIFDNQINTPDFKSVAINVGSNTQYTDDSEAIWIEDRPYSSGSYGHVEGVNANLNLKSMITHTEDTPLFYSYLDNLKAYRLDVAPGRYEVELCFAETEKLAPGNRIFDVYINDAKVMDRVDLVKDNGFAVASKHKFIVETDKGLYIRFDALKGKAVLNGLKVKKL
jgi:beta-galactosidase